MKYIFSIFIIALLTVPASAQTMWKINTIAGNGTQGFLGDGNFARAAELSGPIGVDIDTAGNIYIVDFYNNRVRKVNCITGTITTIAGDGGNGNTGDGSIATSADINPYGVAVDKAGNIFISDPNFGVVRKVTPAGIISRYAGNATYGNSGDGGSAIGAQMRKPYGLAIDALGNLYIADVNSHVVRKVTAATGKISTVAGNDTAGYAGDFGLATKARLDSPYAVAVDRIGNVYISDHRNNVIRKVDTFHVITTYAGTYNTYGHTGDGFLAVSATLNAPKGIAVDSIGQVFICDADNHVIRRVDTFGKIATIVATGFEGFGGDLGDPIGAQLDNPYDIAVDKNGSLYIADANNQRVRKVYNATYLGVNNVTKNNITVYPNPATGNIMVSNLVKSDRVVVYDMAGRQVSEMLVTADGTQTLQLNTLTPGTYVLKVTDNSGGNKTTVQMSKE